MSVYTDSEGEGICEECIEGDSTGGGDAAMSGGVRIYGQ